MLILQLRRADRGVSRRSMRVPKNEAARWLDNACTHRIGRTDGTDVLGRCVYDVVGLG